MTFVPWAKAASCRRIDAVSVAVGILRIRRRIRATSIPRGVRPPVIPIATPDLVGNDGCSICWRSDAEPQQITHRRVRLPEVIDEIVIRITCKGQRNPCSRISCCCIPGLLRFTDISRRERDKRGNRLRNIVCPSNAQHGHVVRVLRHKKSHVLPRIRALSLCRSPDDGPLLLALENEISLFSGVDYTCK